MSEATNPMEPVPGEPPKKPKGDLGIRTVSAVVMVAVTLLAFSVGRQTAGGAPLLVFVGLIFIGLIWEFWALVRLITSSIVARGIWLLLGSAYFALAVFTLLFLVSFFGNGWMLAIGSVIATDIGAYFAGRTFGGPKIAPKISPSKTWAGLIGGMILAAIFMLAAMPWTFHDFDSNQWMALGWAPALAGALAAVIAQTGDFFESWMKRRAGVKDSGRLIPGHGGIFDRLDGLIAVLFVGGLLYFGGGIRLDI